MCREREDVALVPVALVAVIWVLARPSSAAGQRVQPLMSAYPGLRVGLIGLVVALTVGFLLNDSGTAIPAAAALVLAPALLVMVGAVTLDDVRAHVAARLDPTAAPRELHLVAALPLRGPGKVDRKALRDMLTAQQ